jgi:hypothetical protein
MSGKGGGPGGAEIGADSMTVKGVLCCLDIDLEVEDMEESTLLLPSEHLSLMTVSRRVE